jgi:mono/diheme cytochrome c family protein
MPAWGERLAPDLIDEIARHVMTLVSRRPETPRTTISEFLAAPPGSAEDGRLLYVTYCSICHGPQGKGDGFYADTLHARNNIRPRDLTDTAYFDTKTDEELYVTIALGGGHGGKSQFMPAWNVTLEPEQMKSLLSYVRAISATSPTP